MRKNEIMDDYTPIRKSTGGESAIPSGLDRELFLPKYDSASRTLSGYTAVYEAIDVTREYFPTGAFDDFVSGKSKHVYFGRVRVVIEHDLKYPVSKVDEFKSDKYGLWFSSEVPKKAAEVTYVKDRLLLLEAGVIDELSVGAMVKNSSIEWDEARDALRLGEGAVRDVSIVTLGAQPLALMDVVKKSAADGDEAAARMLKSLGKATGMNVTDETGRQIEEALAVLKSIRGILETK